MFDDDDFGKRRAHDIPPGEWPFWWRAVQLIGMGLAAVLSLGLVGYALYQGLRWVLTD